MGQSSAMKKTWVEGLEMLVVGLALSGLTVSVVFRKLAVALVSLWLLVMVFRRVIRRTSVPAQPASRRALGAIFVLSVLEMGVLVEMTQLPVRFDQPGFEMTHWLWVLLGLAVLFIVQVAWFRPKNPPN